MRGRFGTLFKQLECGSFHKTALEVALLSITALLCREGERARLQFRGSDRIGSGDFQWASDRASLNRETVADSEAAPASPTVNLPRAARPPFLHEAPTVYISAHGVQGSTSLDMTRGQLVGPLQ